MHPEIVILGYSEASMLLKQHEGESIGAIISIHGQREYAVESPHVSHRLALVFDDVEAPRGDDLLQASRIRLRQREAASFGLNQQPPTQAHAQAIVTFAESIREMRGVLLCQCFAGISRSPAAALICLALWNGPGSERACVESVLSVRPAARPHADLVAFGDAVLGRGGALIAAVDSLC